MHARSYLGDPYLAVDETKHRFILPCSRIEEDRSHFCKKTPGENTGGTTKNTSSMLWLHWNEKTLTVCITKPWIFDPGLNKG
jgi:hypothetical protein